MLNNIMPLLLQTARTGGNVRAAIQQLAGNDPVARQFLSMIDGKSPAQLQMMAENMAKERGISVNDVMNKLGITRASNR